MTKMIVEIVDGKIVRITSNEDLLVKVINESSLRLELFRQIVADEDFEEANRIADAKLRHRFYREGG